MMMPLLGAAAIGSTIVGALLRVSVYFGRCGQLLLLLSH